MTVLAIGAHHDDIELGAGGTMEKYVRSGDRVYGLVLTNSETHYEIRNIYRTKEAAVRESQAASRIIGFSLIDPPEELQSNNGELEYSTGYMRFVEELIHEHNIDTCLVHWTGDVNTDHAAAAQISIVAARHVPRVLMYRSNWYQTDRTFNGTIYTDITEVVDIKTEALRAYAGEIDNRGEDWISTFIEASRINGFSVGVKFAEVFAPIRYLA